MYAYLGGVTIEKNEIKYIDAVIDHYYRLKESISIEELQTIFTTTYPSNRIKLNKEDWAICNLYVGSNDSPKVCDYFETVKNRIAITKTSSLQTSEIFINKLLAALQPYHEEIYGTIEPFKEAIMQGLMLCIYNKTCEEPFYIWAGESENEELVIVTSKEKVENNLYLSDDYDQAQVFPKGHFSDAIVSAISQLDYFLGKDLNTKI